MMINPQMKLAVRYAAKHPEESLAQIAMRFRLRADPKSGNRILCYYTRRAGLTRPRGAAAPAYDRSVLRRPRPQTHKFDHAEAIRLSKSGLTGREIARRMGVSQPTISDMLIRAGLRSNTVHNDKRTLKYLLAHPRMPRATQAKNLGYSIQGLSKALERIREAGHDLMRS